MIVPSNSTQKFRGGWLLHTFTLHYTTLHYTTLHYTTLYYTTLHYTIPHYTTTATTHFYITTTLSSIIHHMMRVSLDSFASLSQTGLRH